MPNKPKNILITGASSGIGRALALTYATPGATLFLCARRLSKLEEVRKSCEELGAQVVIKEVDVACAEQVVSFIKHAFETTPLDLVIANAGISINKLSGEENHENVLNLFQTNVLGVTNTIYPVLELMRAQGHGQIAIISSVAGLYNGMPACPAYSASKSCLIALGRALRLKHKLEGISINVICPGFIKTELTAQNNFRMPFIMEAEAAAKKVKKALQRDIALFVFPVAYSYATKVFASLPKFTQNILFKLMPKKS